MTKPVISVEHLTKKYDLGVIGTGTISRDLNRWWARVRKQPDPYTRIGQKDAFERIGETILALDDVSFTVQQGEALGIIGRNGAGKSTLLKILSRVTAPTSGVVKVKGRIGSLLEVGTGFHPELTGRENVYLNGAILGMRKAEVTRKFDEILDFAGVEKFIDTPVKRYSSGMYVRLAFAVAAHLDPEILIVDEVLAVGDAEFQKKCLGKMSDVAGEGRTVLFVSHNMAAIQQLCEKTLVLKSGEISCQDSTREAINHYLFFKKDNSKSQGSPIAVNIQRNFSLEKIRFRNFQNMEIPAAISGDELFIDLYFNSKEIIQNLYISIGINSKEGTRLSVLHSKLSGYEISVLSEKSRISCHIKNLNLLANKYLLDVKIYADKEPIVWAETASELIVEPGNILQSGKLPNAEWGGFFVIDHDWSHAN